MEWGKSGLKPNKQGDEIRLEKRDIGGTIHTTILRKSAVSGVHCATNSSETHSDLADLMAHDVATARHYYKLNEKSKSSVKASRQLTQMCHAWRETIEGK